MEKENAALRKRIEELERLLGMNSRNSSMPPSSDGPNAPAQSQKLRRRKRGARKGHEPHLRELAPPEKVTRRIELKVKECVCGGRCLELCEQEPWRHQIVDIPPIVPEVTEYVQYAHQCKDCGEFVYVPLPDDVKRTHFGPGVLALVAIMTGELNTSKRKALAMMNEVFSVPMSLGGLSNCESRISDLLRRPYDETLAHVRGQGVAHADETGWRRGNHKRGWLWTLCDTTAAVFMVHAKRSQPAA
ncbi:MAG: transposase, partial [Nitrospiraceae bacterium]|nr:transposase [Nitrospiraceae bacterium]